MNISNRLLAKGAAWTTGTYAFNQIVRLLTNVALARLLAPEIFGVMLIVNSLRTGADLISDLGVGQNIVHNKDADDPQFYNTAWTLQVLRGIFLWIVSTLAIWPFSILYNSSILLAVIPVAALAFIFSGFTSVSRFLLQKRLQFVRLNLYETGVVVISGLANVLLAYLYPSIWALIFGNLVGYAAAMLGSFFLVPGLREHFYISRKYLKQIMHFGLWIFGSSIVYFLSMNFDRLYLAKLISFQLLGIYGIARSLSELLALLVARLSSAIIFPIVAALSNIPRTELREKISSKRLPFLLFGAFGFSIFTAMADLLIDFFYDARYRAAGWMLPILIIGTWCATLCNVNESTLLGVGKPSYGAIGNGLKFFFLVLALPITFSVFGSLGSVAIVAISDLVRYIPLSFGQRREGVFFATQDLLVTIFMLGLVVFWQWVRWLCGLGTSFDGLATAAFL